MLCHVTCHFSEHVLSAYHAGLLRVPVVVDRRAINSTFDPT